MKLPLASIPVVPLSDLARVFAFGNAKYGEDDNWRYGIEVRRSLSALLRHAFAVLAGEDIDRESGLPHLAHVAWNAITLQECMRTGAAKDDRVEQPWEPSALPGVIGATFKRRKA